MFHVITGFKFNLSYYTLQSKLTSTSSHKKWTSFHKNLNIFQPLNYLPLTNIL